MKLKIIEIKMEMKYLPRVQLDVATIERYKEAYEIGEDLPPIVVQKKKNILIDGFHRFEAQRQLGRLEIEVELLDIPEDQIYVEAVRCASEHGLPPNVRDVDDQIFNLRVIYKLTLKQIGELVKKHESTVSKRLNANPRFKILSSQDTKKIDRRRKEYDPQKIIDRLDEGEKAIDVALDMGVSPATITQVKKEAEETKKLLDKHPIVVCLDGPRFRNMFLYTTLGGRLDIEANFQEDALYITSKIKQENPSVFAKFSKHYFDNYSVKEPLTWFIAAKSLRSMFDMKSIRYATYLEMVLIGDRLEMKFEGGGNDATYSPDKIMVGQRPISSGFDVLDENGIFGRSTTIIKVKRSEFGGMPQFKHGAIVKFAEDVLTIGGISQGWKFVKEISILESNGEDVQINVDGDALRNIIFNLEGGAFNIFLINDEKKSVMVNRSGEFYYVNHVAV